MATYEVTLKMEVLGEFCAGIISDIDNYMEKNNIKEDSKNPIVLLLDDVLEIKRNVLYQNTMEDMLKMQGSLIFVNKYIKKLEKING